MPTELSTERARLLRLRAQGLGEDGADLGVANVVSGCLGLQAQDSNWAPLGIHARGHGTTASAVDRARYEERSIVRTWCIRGTLHFVIADDLPWLRSLFGPLFVDRGRRRLADLGLEDEEAGRAVEVVRDALGDDGPLTRHEIAERLLEAGFTIDPDGQAPIHVVRRACLEGVAIEAGSRDGTETYVLLDDWVSLDSAPEREDALAELARRYVAANEPATPEDFYTWSGLYKRDVRTGWDAIEDDLTEVQVESERAWVVSSHETVDPGDSPVVRLLPMYDGYFLGHRDRSLVLPDEHVDRVYPGGGVIRATVLADGVAIGTWSLDRSSRPAVVRVDPFDPFDPVVDAEVAEEVGALGRFLETQIEYRVDSGGG